MKTPSGRRPRRTAVIAALAALLPSLAAAQQTGRIVGRVTSAESGVGIAEAQVYIPGTGIGTLTRQNGSFILLEVPAGPHPLRAERIGLSAATRQITVTAGQAVEVNLEMATQALGLDEIVVTGAAGAARRREVGNSIAQINVAEIPDRPKAVADLLQASAPGVEVSGVSGQVGGGTKIRLRGATSMTQSNSPIIYVDGIRIQSQAFPEETFGDTRPRTSGLNPSPINDINPSDIERIEVIKGAAATTLYGTEASAGVIQIFTKRGSSGRPVWTAEASQGTMWTRRFGPAAEPYMRMDLFTCTGLFKCGRYLGVPYTQSYSASLRGGGETLQYFGSTSYTNESGVLPDNLNKVWSFRSNFTATPVRGLQVQWNSAYTNHRPESPQEGGAGEGLTLNVFRAEVNYYGTADPEIVSQSLQWHIFHNIDRFTTGGTVNYTPLANVTNRFTIGFDYSQDEQRNLRPVGFPFWPLGALYVSVYQSRNLTFDYVGTYRFNLTSKVNSSFSWGGQAVGNERSTTGAWGEGFPGAKDPTISSAAATTAYESRAKVWNAGFFLQDLIGVADRYFLTLGLRVDGNSAFGSGFGLQMYPKASASWVVSDESWWRAGWGQVKLRTAYGQSGKAPGAFDAVRTWQSYGFLSQSSFVPRNVGNPDLGPEVSAELEAGLDASWLENRISSALTYYHQTTSNALFNVSQVPSQGFGGTQALNVGKIRNTGLELTVNGSILQRQSFGWDLGVDVSTHHSRTLDLGGAPPFSVGGGSYVVEGYPAPVRRARVVKNPEAIAAPVFENSVYLGPVTPTHTWGVNTSVHLPAGITLAARGDFRGGFYWNDGASSGAVSRSVRWPICFPYYQYPEGIVQKEPLKTSVALKPDTPALWRARCTPATGNNDMYTVKGDYFRLRSVTAQIPMSFALPDRVTSSTLTVGLYNSWTWYNQDFLMWDPEMVGDPDGLVDSPGMRLPIPISLRASLQVQF